VGGQLEVGFEAQHLAGLWGISGGVECSALKSPHFTLGFSGSTQLWASWGWCMKFSADL
jgi:hypothetical protein